jgi:hypothetical protein
MDLAEPARVSRVSEEEMDNPAGWSPESDAIICYNQTNIYWIGLDGKTLRKVPTSCHLPPGLGVDEQQQDSHSPQES